MREDSNRRRAQASFRNMAPPGAHGRYSSARPASVISQPLAYEEMTAISKPRRVSSSTVMANASSVNPTAARRSRVAIPALGAASLRTALSVEVKLTAGSLRIVACRNKSPR